jgi:hypothetical protein
VRRRPVSGQLTLPLFGGREASGKPLPKGSGGGWVARRELVHFGCHPHAALIEPEQTVYIPREEWDRPATGLGSVRGWNAHLRIMTRTEQLRCLCAACCSAVPPTRAWAEARLAVGSPNECARIRAAMAPDKVRED